MQLNQRIRIINNYIHFFLNSDPPFRCNHWLSNVRAILDRHHILYNLYIRVPLIITYGSINIIHSLEINTLIQQAFMQKTQHLIMKFPGFGHLFGWLNHRIRQAKPVLTTYRSAFQNLAISKKLTQMSSVTTRSSVWLVEQCPVLKNF